MSAAPNPIPPESKSPSDLLQLTVKTADASAEVFVIDNSLNLAAPRGIGGLEAHLAPGIYKVRVRTGFANSEKLVVLRNEPAELSFDALQFATPLPLAGTATTHEYHEEAASEESKKIHVQAGQGSSIFLFVREWKKAGAPPATPPANPATGLALKALDGSIVADVEKASSTFSGDFPGDPWAACNVALNAGAYRVSVKTGQGEFEQSVIAPQDWHVHVFLTLRNYAVGGQSEDRHADLATGGITLSRSQQFAPGNEDARLVELARQGLAQKRKVLSTQLRNEILFGKFQDPMLGIFGGHLLLLEDPVDTALLTQVVFNLRNMLGSEHPDVEALALKLGLQGKPYEVRVPPMLRRSWQLMLDGTADQRSMVMRDGFAAEIFNRTCSGEPWLLWAAAGSAGEVAETDMEEVLKQHIFGRQPQETHATRGISFSHLADVFGAGKEGFAMASASGGGETAAEPVHDFSVDEEVQPARVSQPEVSISPTKLGELIRDLGAPRYYVEDMLKKLNVTLLDK